MNSEDDTDQERGVRERIVSLMHSIGRASHKPISAEELQTLKVAADRLNQMLQATADADAQALRSAAMRLDQLLSDICAGKDVSDKLKRAARRPNEG